MDHDSPRQQAAETLGQIETIERETYLSTGKTDPVPKRFVAVAVVGAIICLSAILWMFSQSEWWALPVGLLMVVVFVAAVTRMEKKYHGVRPKTIMPGHVQKVVLKQHWPVYLCIFFGVMPLVLIVQSEPPLAVIVLTVTGFILASTFVAYLTRKLIRSNTTR